MVERSLDVLGVRLRVSTDAPELVDTFFEVFGAFEAVPSAPRPDREMRLRFDAARGRAVVGDHILSLASGSLAPVQAYNLLYRTLARSISSAFLLHAAAVSAGDRAIVIAAPSGSGKTSLARSLASSGFRLMSDDIAPLSVLDSLVHPFPRRVGVVPDGAAKPTSGVTVGSKLFVEARELGVAIEPRALPLGAIVLMNPYAEDEGSIPVRVGVLGDGSALLSRLEGASGVEVIGVDQAREMAVVELRATGGAACTAVDRAIEACEVDLVFHVREYGDVKRYASQPVIEEVSARATGVELLREALNREPSGELLARHGGSLVSALVELTGLVAASACYRLTPGSLEANASLLRERFLPSA
jgi:hypothetical protein